MQAVQIARSTEGVRDVIDQLNVNDTAAIQDNDVDADVHVDVDVDVDNTQLAAL